MTLVTVRLSGSSNLAIGNNATEEGFDEKLEAIEEAMGMLMDLIMFILEERN